MGVPGAAGGEGVRLAWYRVRYWCWSAVFDAARWLLRGWTDDILSNGWRARLVLGAASRSWSSPEEDWQWWLTSQSKSGTD